MSRGHLGSDAVVTSFERRYHLFIGWGAMWLLLGCGQNESLRPEESSRGGVGANASGAPSSAVNGGSHAGDAPSSVVTGGRGTTGSTESGTVPLSQTGGASTGRGSDGLGGHSSVLGGAGSIDGVGGSGGAVSGGTNNVGGSTSGSSHADVIANFENGVFLNDVNGKRIEAHGGGFLWMDGTYYWFGEDKSHNSGGFKAVNCYASTDLQHWQFRRAIITPATATALSAADRIIERPKVVYNEKTKQFVMWLHWEGKNYAEAAAGVFTSSTVDGPYVFKSSFRPNNNMSRDDTLFKDDDGKAYFLSAANENADLVLYELSDDYLTIARQVMILWAGAKREAPAVFKNNGRYFLITSACTGWDPNQAQYAWATSMVGPWSARTNLGNGTTYDSQSTYVLPIVGTQETTYVYVGDRWQDPDLVSSKYIFLPLKLDGTSLQLDYYEKWQLNLTTGNWAVNDGYVSQKDWKLIFVDSEETSSENGRAARAFDDSGLTFWHTEYSSKKPGYPHEIQIDMGRTYELEGFRYLPRQDKDAGGMVARYEVYVSENSGDFGTPVASGTFADTRNETVVRFTKKTGRYLRFAALSALAGSNLASVGELDVLGVAR